MSDYDDPVVYVDGYVVSARREFYDNTRGVLIRVRGTTERRIGVGNTDWKFYLSPTELRRIAEADAHVHTFGPCDCGVEAP